MPLNGSKARILLVEKEAQLAHTLAQALASAGFATIAVRSGARALDLVERTAFDLVVIDLNLPDRDARNVCQELRRRNGVPVVMLAASLAAADRDAWLDGAEDYVVLPAGNGEVISRIRAVLRRTHAAQSGSVHVGPLELDLESRRALLDGEDLVLTPKELELLARLARDAGRIVTREQLMRDVWGTEWLGSTKTLDVHVGWLRRKLGDDPADPHFVHTVRGVGFRLASAAELAASATYPSRPRSSIP